MKTFIIVFSLMVYSIGFSQDTIPTILKVPASIETYESNAEFPGGQKAMMKFLASEIKYPQIAIKNNISGRVYLKFKVEKDGTISDINIARGMANCPECEQEAIRVVKSMPKWTPAVQNDQYVSSYFLLPFNFQLQ